MKKLRVFLDKLAVMELEDAAEYYELELAGLGERFKHDIKKAISRIKRYPEAWPLEWGEIRRYLLHSFPYKILYSIEKNHIYIIAIAHCHRRPDYWIDRQTRN